MCVCVCVRVCSHRYMEKLAVGPEVPSHLVSLDYSVERNLNEVARALRKPVRWVCMCVCVCRVSCEGCGTKPD